MRCSMAPPHSKVDHFIDVFDVIQSHSNALVGNSILNISEKIKKRNIKFSKKISEEAREIVNIILTHDPEHRPSLEDILSHPLISSAEEEISNRQFLVKKSFSKKSRKDSSIGSQNKRRAEKGSFSNQRNPSSYRKKLQVSSVNQKKYKNSRSFRQRDYSYKFENKKHKFEKSGERVKASSRKFDVYSSSSDIKDMVDLERNYKSATNSFHNIPGGVGEKPYGSNQFQNTPTSKFGSGKKRFFSKRIMDKGNVSIDRKKRRVNYHSTILNSSRDKSKKYRSPNLKNITKNLRSEIFRRLGLSKNTSPRKRSPVSSRKLKSKKNHSYDFSTNMLKFNKEAQDLYGLNTQSIEEGSFRNPQNVKLSSKNIKNKFSTLSSQQSYNIRNNSNKKRILNTSTSKNQDKRSLKNLTALTKKLNNYAQYSEKKDRTSRKMRLRTNSSSNRNVSSRLKSQSTKIFKTTANFSSNRKENVSMKRSFMKSSGVGKFNKDLAGVLSSRKRNLVTRKSKNMRSFTGYGQMSTRSKDNTKNLFR